VCGMKIKGNPYYCDQCVNLLNKIEPIEQIEWDQGVA